MRRTNKLELIGIDELIPYANNARTHSKEQIIKLRSSLREFGFVNPVLIDKDKTIIAGHGRVMAAKEEGIKEIPCVLVEHLTEAQKKAYIIADNKLALDAGWDNQLLEVELKALEELDFNLELTGFDLEEIDKILMLDQEVVEDDFDVDQALNEPTISKPGDLWILGRHRLICGDSTEPETFEKLMDGNRANLVLTDPPYNVNYEAKAGTIQNDDMKDEEYYNFLLDSFVNIHKVMERDASIYVFHADTEGLNCRKAFADAGFYLSGTCIWKKQSLVLGRSPYQWQHEPILFGWKQKGKHNWYSDRKQTTIWEYDRPTKSVLHPTMKPVELCAYPIQNSSMSNCIILDAFGGSGSVLIASEQTNRICYTVELEEKFVDVIVKRYINYVGGSDKVYLIRDGKKIGFDDVDQEELTLEKAE